MSAIEAIRMRDFPTRVKFGIVEVLSVLISHGDSS